MCKQHGEREEAHSDPHIFQVEPGVSHFLRGCLGTLAEPRPRGPLRKVHTVPGTAMGRGLWT